MAHDFHTEMADQLGALRADVGEIKGAIYGPERTPYFGLLPRVEAAEERIQSLESIQESFVDEERREAAQREKRERRNARLVTAVLATFGAILSGIVVQLFVLIVGGGP